MTSAADANVIVIMPAYNAAATLERTVSAIPRDIVNDVIVVDDNSSDSTLKIAQRLNVHTIWHPHNVGYGGNQRTCYLEALQRGADVVVMLHPDGQYEPSLIPRMVEPILRGDADLVLGSRFAAPGQARAGGMPLYKIVANRVLTGAENWILGTSFSEMHTGYRAYSKKFLMTVPFLRNNNGFVFDSEILMQAIHFGFSVAEVPARSIYFDDASSIGFKPALAYGLRTLGVGGRLILHRRGIFRCNRFEP
jgi:glycosyltransferase involved in cell wall biosynthesis